MSNKGPKEKDRMKDRWDKALIICKCFSFVMIPILLFFVKNAYEKKRDAVEQALKEKEVATREIEIVHEFLPQLQSNDETERETALLAISGLGEAKLATDLAASFRTKGAISALANIASSSDPEQSKKSVEILVEALVDDTPEVRRAATLALKRIRGPHSKEILIAMLKKEQWKARAAAARALGRIGGKEQIETLENFLNTEKEGNENKSALFELEESICRIKARYTEFSKELCHGNYFCDETDCSGHSQKYDHCAYGCDSENCPGHASPFDECETSDVSQVSDKGTVDQRSQSPKGRDKIDQGSVDHKRAINYCGKPDCPGHASPNDNCPYYCGKKACPGHSSPTHRCR
jgi:hypothetical protein